MSANNKNIQNVQATAATQAAAPTPKAGAPAKAGQAQPPAQQGNDGFKKTLTVFDMVIYGLIFMVPIAPFSIYAAVSNASGGMPALAYLIAFVAMLFTVLSFGVMIRTFPSSGSIYTYTSKSIGKGLGFIAGWLMLLQYLVTPDMVYVIGAEPLSEYVPQVPVWGWCLIFLVFVLIVTTRGIQTAMIVNRIALVIELIVLAMFLVFGVVYIVGHPETASWAPTAFFNPSTFNMGDVMGAVSLAVFSYVGFGCVATLTQEAKDSRFGPSRAMFIMVVVLAVLFALTCYIATCVDPSGQICHANENNGFYDIAALVGGKWFGITCAVAVALSQGVFTGMVAQVSVSRILYVMGRSGSLPKPLAKMNSKGVPIVATVFVSVVSAALLFFFLQIGMEEIAKIVNFGALSTYFLLNICVIAYYWVRKKDHSNPMHMLICPIIGALVTGYIFISLNTLAYIVGFAWTAIGVVYYLVARYALHRDISMGDDGN